MPFHFWKNYKIRNSCFECSRFRALAEPRSPHPGKHVKTGPLSQLSTLAMCPGLLGQALPDPVHFIPPYTAHYVHVCMSWLSAAADGGPRSLDTCTLHLSMTFSKTLVSLSPELRVSFHLALCHPLWGPEGQVLPGNPSCTVLLKRDISASDLHDVIVNC